MLVKNMAIPVLAGAGRRVGIVRARFNEEITEKLLASALVYLGKCGVKKKDITVLTVPGAMEIPFVLQKLARTKKYDCLIPIGCVIRGETPHFDYVCQVAVEGSLRVSLDYSVPLGFGVLTANSLAQARARLNLGAQAAAAALELALL